MRPAVPLTSAERDRALRRVRVVAWAAGIGAAAVTGGLSVAAAHAFKGHSSTDSAGTRTATVAPRATATPAPAAAHRVHVPPAEDVPAIAGSPDSLAPPQQAPTTAPAAPAQVPAPPPPVSGGS